MGELPEVSEEDMSRGRRRIDGVLQPSLSAHHGQTRELALQPFDPVPKRDGGSLALWLGVIGFEILLRNNGNTLCCGLFQFLRPCVRTTDEDVQICRHRLHNSEIATLCNFDERVLFRSSEASETDRLPRISGPTGTPLVRVEVVVRASRVPGHLLNVLSRQLPRVVSEDCVKVSSHSGDHDPADPLPAQCRDQASQHQEVQRLPDPDMEGRGI